MKQQNKIQFPQIISVTPLQSLVQGGVIYLVNTDSSVYVYEYLDESYDIQVSGCTIYSYLDKFILVLPDDTYQRRMIWRYIYKNYAKDYEKMIDQKHNLQCIQYMLNILQREKYNEVLNVLDFGCGTGLSSNADFIGQIYGYDINRSMRKIAYEKGMKVLTEEDFWNLPAECFQGVLASYALHMAVSESELDRIVSILINNGLLVANFYKGIDCDRVTEKLVGMNMVIEEKEENRGFGQIYVYRKRRERRF